jgi:peptidoglycan/LPS O-acetylase OafA/YrhL
MPSLQQPLERPFSLYLDLTRLLAAVAVVFAHFEFFGIIPAGAWGVLPDMGREAVIVFFVLSGFVIASSTAQKSPSARDYAVARLSRLYSVALPVLLLAFAGAALLRALTDFESSAYYTLDKFYLYLPFHLLFLGEHWQLTEVPPFMLPYWSLGYEAWYYLLFGLACYLRGARRTLAMAVVLVLMGYKLWLLLPVWLSGVWLSRYYRKSGGRALMSVNLARLGWFASVLAFGLYAAIDVEAGLRAAALAWWPFPALPLGSADRFLSDYLVCAIVLANFACAREARFTALLRFGPAWQLAASYTFTLYLSHALVIAFWLALYPHDPRSTVDVLAVSALIAASTAVLGAVTEGRRQAYRRVLERLLGAGRRGAVLPSALGKPGG